MKLQTTTDYGIRVMIFLSNKDTLITASEIAKEVGASYAYLNKVLRCLRDAEMIETVQGGQGGYRIMQTAQSATLYDVIKIMQGEIHLNSCLEDNHYCSRKAEETCSIRAVFESAGDHLIKELSSVTLSELAKSSRVGRGKLVIDRSGEADMIETESR